MVSCGSPVPRGRRAGKMSGLHPSRPTRRAHGGWLARAVLAFAVLWVLAGCTAKWGWPPKTDRLETLQRGVSTKADVLLALGGPRGKGIARNADVRLRQAWGKDDTREIWFYEFAKAGLTQTNTKILLVFFHNEIYDGYVWYSSALLLKATQ